MTQRRKIQALAAGLILSLTAAHAQSVCPGQHSGRMAVADAVRPSAQSFDLHDVRLLPGRVRENLERDSAWMVNISVNRLVQSFRNNAGVFAGLEGGYEAVKKYGGWESLDCDLRGHTTGHLLSAYSLMYAATGEEIFRLKGDSIVAALHEVQDALGDSGYLSAFPERLIDRNLKGERVWAPWYTLHKIMGGLIDQYLNTGNTEALDMARRMGDWAWGKLNGLPEETRRLMLRNEFGGMNDAFFNLYGVTGDTRYLELARFFHHNDVIDPLRAGNDDFGTRHTNTFIPKIIGETRDYELTGDEAAMSTARLFWDSVTGKHCFATGSCSQKEHFFDPEKMSAYINGYTGETCCTYNMLKLARHIFCNSPEGATGDFYERALFNHILAQQDTETGMVCYFLPLLSGAYKVYSTPENSFWCCVGSGFESHSKYGESIYFHDGADRLFVNLFIPSTLNWSDAGIKLSQHTLFPESDTVTLTIDEASGRDATLSFRLPYWSGTPEVKVNGKRVKVKSDRSSFLNISRRWRKGDRVEVRYPMSLHIEYPAGDKSRGALLYGPVVLAGDLGTEGMTPPAPFSDPTVRNDYYTYDYHIPAGLDTTLPADADTRKDYVRRLPGEGLRFATADGKQLLPLYDAHHIRYVVYWDLENR